MAAVRLRVALDYLVVGRDQVYRPTWVLSFMFAAAALNRTRASQGADAETLAARSCFSTFPFSSSAALSSCECKSNAQPPYALAHARAEEMQAQSQNTSIATNTVDNTTATPPNILNLRQERVSGALVHMFNGGGPCAERRGRWSSPRAWPCRACGCRGGPWRP